MKRVLITGGAGFIGSSLADRLAQQGLEVVIYDNFSTGRREFLDGLIDLPNVELIEADLLDMDRLVAALDGCDTVFHLAANADVRYGLDHPRRDLEQNTIVTSNVLEAMRANDVKRIAFSSTGSVYGEPEIFPTPESCPFPVQTSLYAASKLACEGLIQAYSNGYGFEAVIFRFVSILGERYTHGHVFDFYKQLREDPTSLTVLGDGKQEKSYLYIQDCVSGILSGLSVVKAGEAQVFNLGTDQTIVVDRSIDTIAATMNVQPERTYTGGKRGWTGDSPLILLDCSLIRSKGWQPKLTVTEAVERTVRWFDLNPWVFA